MDDIIKVLIDADTLAQKKVKQAHEQKSDIANIVKEDTKQLNIEYQNKVDQICDEHLDTINKELDIFKDDKNKHLNITLNKMEDTFNANKQLWVNQIKENCIK